MRILLFTENLHCGGLDSFLINLVNHWPDAEDELIILCNPRHPGYFVLRDAIVRPCKVERHHISTYGELVIGTRSNPILQNLRRIISPLLKIAYFVRYICGLRCIFNEIGADRLLVVNGGHPGGDTCRAAIISWRLFVAGKPRAIYNFHGLATSPRKVDSWQERMLDRLVIKSAGPVVGVSRACAESLRSRIGDAAMRRVSWIYNGIGISPLTEEVSSVREELALSSEVPLCLMLATYEAGKGHRFLLQSFRLVCEAIPAAQLLICGYGYEHEVVEVRRMVKFYGLTDHVTLKGFRRDVTALMRQADVLVVPSQAPESFGLTCVEAMANRTPVVATRVGGIPEVVSDGDGGFCVDSNDIRGFANHIIALLNDASFRCEQGRRGEQRYARMFSASRMACEYAKQIHEDGEEFAIANDVEN